MKFSDAVRTCFSKYATFSGRASRSEYWWFFLFIMLFSFIFAVIDGTFFGFGEFDPSPISTIFSLATLVPSIAVAARRLHDTDRSGWWQIAPISMVLLTVVMIAMGANILAFAAGATAIICVVLVLIWFVKKGTDGENHFGADPLPPQGGSGDSYSPSSIPKVK